MLGVQEITFAQAAHRAHEAAVAVFLAASLSAASPRDNWPYPPVNGIVVDETPDRPVANARRAAAG